MASSSYSDFCMINREFFHELEKVGIKFNEDGSKCALISGEEYRFCFEDGDAIPYLGFNKDFMIGMYLEYFLGCGSSKFGYQFMKILTENGFFESDFDFTVNPYDEHKYYESNFFRQFRMTEKLTDFDRTIENARVESVEYDGEITAFRAVVSNGVMTVCDLQFEVEVEDFCDLYNFLNMMDEYPENDELAQKKILQDGRWVEQ